MEMDETKEDEAGGKKPRKKQRPAIEGVEDNIPISLAPPPPPDPRSLSSPLPSDPGGLALLVDDSVGDHSTAPSDGTPPLPADLARKLPRPRPAPPDGPDQLGPSIIKQASSSYREEEIPPRPPDPPANETIEASMMGVARIDNGQQCQPPDMCPVAPPDAAIDIDDAALDRFIASVRPQFEDLNASESYQLRSNNGLSEEESKMPALPNRSKAAKHPVPSHRKAVNPKERPVHQEDTQMGGPVYHALFQHARTYLASHEYFRTWDPGRISQEANSMARQWISQNYRPRLPAAPLDVVRGQHPREQETPSPFRCSTSDNLLVSQGAHDRANQSIGPENRGTAPNTGMTTRGPYKKKRQKTTHTPSSALTAAIIDEELPPQQISQNHAFRIIALSEASSRLLTNATPRPTTEASTLNNHDEHDSNAPQPGSDETQAHPFTAEENNQTK